ncbi:molybdopterin-dependent oxidoreductase [Lichenihabitans sp. PAMC28606]|uniref:molybdopterin-dependent oxidoreductase n=1 Tax=Lichenihabitans sp. PAMC28606 TaxID=2880932 RepID=UPI001D09DDD4|nr:molybdopterin-dependent oxidoreductase [Lichenihabitans sp. PAMC28606]UDL93097.1 molybdopterin-dependent oxidoreductase [Lichenihabitans sp. PAMC28606]
MVRRRPTSLFHPIGSVDQRVLKRQSQLVTQLNRRGVLRGAVSLGALTMLTGCDISDDEQVRGALEAVSALNNRVQAALFDPNKLAPTYAVDQVLKPPRYNAYYPVDKVRPIDLTTWQLAVTGLVQDQRPWRPADFATMPQREDIIRHVCVEGWDYIGQWSGVPLRAFLEKVGADLTARYVGFKCFDGYTSSIDMAAALHPQTLLATHYAGEPLGDPFGAPVRLRTAIKLGYKNPKWITEILVSNTWRNGYWEDRGYNWFGGI